MNTSDITHVEGAIHNPADPKHFLTINVTCAVNATVMGRYISCAKFAYKVKEVHKDISDPQLYIPIEFIEEDMLVKSNMTQNCPIKGTAQFYDIHVKDKILKNAAWSYEEIDLDNEALQVLEKCVALDKRYVHVVEIMCMES